MPSTDPDQLELNAEMTKAIDGLREDVAELTRRVTQLEAQTHQPEP